MPRLWGVMALERKPMDTEQMEVIYEAIQSGDRERIRTLFAHDVIHHNITLAMQYKGFDAAFDGVRDLLKQVESTFTVQAVDQRGDFVTSFFTAINGVRNVEFQGLHVFRMDEYVIAESWVFFPRMPTEE
jgi:predicted SnoaL-like aldol condensation-catalyzing enzyme